MKTMTEQYTPTTDDLRKIAESATPGPWEAETWEPFGFEGEIELGVVNHAGGELWDTSGGNCTSSAADAEFIATFNPEAVLALLDRVETTEQAIERVRTIHRSEPTNGYNGQVRYECFACGITSPCPTVAALDGAPEPEEKP